MVANVKADECAAQLSDVVSKQEAILAKADEETNGILSDEQRKEFDALQVENDKLRKTLADIKADDDRRQKIGPRPQRDELASKPEAVSVKVKEDPKMRGFNSHKDFLQSVMAAERGHVDNRLRKLAAGSDEQSTFNDPYGGFLVPEAFSPNLLSLMSEEDPIASMVTQIPMESPTVSIPARTDKNHTSSVSGGLTVSRRDESGSIASSRMQMEKVKLEATSLFGLAYVTEELLTDSISSFVALLEAGFRSEFASELLNERLNGTGTGEFEGVNNSPCKVTVAKEGSQTADTINATNIAKMRSRCWGYQNAVWMANHDCIPTLAAINDGTNNIWLPSAREDVPDILYGRPIYFTEYNETVGDLGDIILVNWSQYLEGTYQPLQSAESMHVRFVNHERTFKFWTRNDGRCWWRSALTVKKGANSLSPVVALAARA